MTIVIIGMATTAIMIGLVLAVMAWHKWNNTTKAPDPIPDHIIQFVQSLRGKEE